MKIKDLKEGEDIYLHSIYSNSYRLCKVAKIMKTKISLYIYDIKDKTSFSYENIEEMTLSKEEGDEKLKIRDALGKINFLLKKPFSSIELNEIFEFAKNIKRSKNEK